MDSDGDIDFTDLSIEFNNLARLCPNTIRFVAHSMGGMYTLRYLSEPAAKYYTRDVGGFYQRNMEYTVNEFYEDIVQPVFLSTASAHVGLPGNDLQLKYKTLMNGIMVEFGYDWNEALDYLYDILKKERQNAVDKVVIQDSPLNGSYGADDLEAVAPLLKDEAAFNEYRSEILSAVTINQFISAIELSTGILLLGIPGWEPLGLIMVADGTICFVISTVIYYTVISVKMVEEADGEHTIYNGKDKILSSSMLLAFDPSCRLWQDVKENSSLVKSYKDTDVPQYYIYDSNLNVLADSSSPVEMHVFSCEAIDFLTDKGDLLNMYGYLVSGLFQRKTGLLGIVAFGSWYYTEEANRIIELLLGGSIAAHVIDWSLPWVWTFLGVNHERGTVLVPGSSSEGIAGGRVIKPIANNPRASVYKFRANTFGYQMMKNIITSGNPQATFPEYEDANDPLKNTWKKQIENNGDMIHNEFSGIHNYTRDLLRYPILRLDAPGSSGGEQQLFLCDYYQTSLNNIEFEVSALNRNIDIIKTQSGQGNQIGSLSQVLKETLDNPSYPLNLTRNLFYYTMFGFMDTPPAGLSFSSDVLYNNKFEFNNMEYFSYNRGLSCSHVEFEGENNRILKSENTLNYMIINNYVKVLPLLIENYYPGIRFRYSINGSNFKPVYHINEYPSFSSLSDLGLRKLTQPVDDESSLVYDSMGRALLISPNFKEGYNTIVIEFEDPFGVRYYKEQTLMQVTVPPFIKPVAPLMNEYVGVSSFPGTVKALDISQGAIKPENWWNDPSTSFEVRVDGVLIQYTKLPDYTVAFDLAGLADGNHQIDFTAHAVGLTCSESWRFWVDTTAPVVSFPQPMLFSNNDKQNMGGISAYIKDSVPFTYASLVKDVDTVMLSHLKMDVTDAGGYPLVTYLDKSNISLGGHGGSWNGWVNDVKLSHGKYFLDVDATDRTGNTAHERGEVIIDNQGPSFNSIDINTSLVNCDTGLLELSYNVGMDEWEDSAKLEMLLENTTANEKFTLETTCNKNEDGTYALAYFASGINVFKDGIYNITVTPVDALGNRGAQKIFSNIVVDRTRPNVRNAYASPFFIGSGATSISVFFTPDENDDVVQLKSGSLPFEIELLDSYGNELAPLLNGSAVPGVELKGNGLSIPAALHDGKYFARIRVRDSHDNVREEVVPFVKNAIGPEITSPRENEIIDGLVTIKGNVVDPRFDNNLGFDRYEMYVKRYEDGDDTRQFDANNLTGWSGSAVSVPEYQKKVGWPASWGRFTVEGGNVLGFLDTRALSEGLVIVLVVAAEKPESAGGTGYRIGSWRTFRILRGGASQYTVAVTVDPAFAGGGGFDFGGGGVLSIPYTVEHAIDNPVTVNCFIREDSTGKIAKQTAFLNLHSNRIKGVPAINADDKGFFIYQKETDNKLYVTIKNSGAASATFFSIISTKLPITGFVDAGGNPIATPATLVDNGKKLMLSRVLSPGDSYTIGFSVAENDEVDFTGLVDQSIPDVFLGGNKILNKAGNIVLYTGTGYPPFAWNGMDEFGRYVTNGAYTIGIEASGALGGRDAKLLPFTIATPALLRYNDSDINNKTFYPGVPGLEYCGIKVHVNKPAIIGAYVRDATTKSHVKTLAPGPQVMSNIGFFNVKWYGDDDAGSIAAEGTYELVVTAAPSDGSIQAQAVIPDIQLKSYQPVDPTVKAEIDAFNEENPTSFNSKELLHGDTKYKVEVKPDGSYLPDKSGTVTVAAKSGTQVAEAYPDLNYMAALRTDYDLLAKAGLTISVTIKVDRLLADPLYYTYTFTLPEKEGKLLGWDFQNNNNNLVRNVIGFEGSTSSKEMAFAGFYLSHSITNITYNVTPVYGQLYMDPSFYALDIDVEPALSFWSPNVSIISCRIDHYNGEVRSKTNFTEGNYLSYSSGFTILGPDVPSQGDPNLHTTSYISRSAALNVYSFIPNDPGAVQNEFVWRQNPSYHFYYVGESYPTPGDNQDPKKNVRQSYSDFIQGYDSEALKFGEIDGVSRIPIPSDFTSSGILTNGSVNFSLTRSGTTYNVTVDTDAYDYILYPYPASDSIFDNRHTIPDAYNVDLPIPTLVINGNRESTSGGEIIPSFHVPRTDQDGSTNIYFDTDPKPGMVFPIMFTYDTDAKSYVDKDDTGIDLRWLLTLSDPILDKLTILMWGVTGYDVPGLYLPNILTIERCAGDIAGNDYSIEFPRDCKPETDPGTTAWSLLEDTLVQQVAGPGADTLAGQRIDLDTVALHRYGKLPPVYVSSLYPSNAISTDEKNMFFIDPIPVKSDNPGVIIDDAIGGNYGIRLEGLDGNPYSALAVDPLGIVYKGKGNKLQDNFSPALTIHDPERLVAFKGLAEHDYTLSYKDTKGNWVDIPVYNANQAENILAYWNVAGLNGLYTIRLVSRKQENLNISFREVYIGNKVAPSSDSTTLESAGGQAKIIFPAGSIIDEKIITIDAVTLDEVKDIAILPDIAPVGKIVKFGPHGESFEALPDYLKPQVHFIYHKSELDTIDPFELAIWHLTESGRLEVIPTIKVVHRIDDAGNDTVIWSSDTDPQAQFPTDYTYLAAYGSVPYFSYYLVLEGNRLESPVINEKDFTTNKTFANVSGTGTPGVRLKTFVTGNPFFDPHAQPPVSTGDGYVRPDGGFFISNVPLLYEGYNFIYIGYDSALASEYSKLVVTRDTTPPVIQMAPYNEYISPNNDGKQDSIDLTMTSTETGHITVEVLDSLSGALVYEKEVACLETVPVTLQIKGIDTEGFTLRDGTYSIRVKAFDALENCTVRDGYPLVIDTRAPRASIVSYQGLISPANRDGAFDVLTIELELSENATVSAWIGNFADPSQRKLLQNMRLDAGTITFFWDGKDDRGNYVRDGSYFFRIRAYDESGNVTETSFSDQRTIVDNTPPQVSLNAKDMQVFVVPAPLSFGFTVSEESTVTISLQDSENRILFTNTCGYSKGNNAVVFNAGEELSDGLYTLVTKAIDTALNSAPEVSKSIEISHDRQPPVLTVPSDLVIEATAIMTRIDIGQAYATDQSPPVTIVNDSPGSFGLGTTTVTWSATDRYGNRATRTQSIRVKDTTPPVLTMPPNVTIEATGITTPVEIGTATASDIFSVTVSNNSPATFGIGNTIVTWTAIDSNGNKTTKEQTVTVVDTTPPVLTIPADISVETTTALTKVKIGSTTATDIFPVTITNDAPDLFPLGVTFVTWQAVDANGNKAEAKQKVSVSRGTFTSAKDTTISKQLPNKNMGATRTLEIDSSPATRILVAFDMQNIRLTGIKKATLVLTIDPFRCCWNRLENTGKAYRIIVDWIEGNGTGAGYGCGHDGGKGSGATWSSPQDMNISNNRPDGTLAWNGGSYEGNGASGRILKNGFVHSVEWDVTADVLKGASYGWLIKTDAKDKLHDTVYYSREGAIAIGKAGLAPKLILEYE